MVGHWVALLATRKIKAEAVHRKIWMVRSSRPQQSPLQNSQNPNCFACQSTSGYTNGHTIGAPKVPYLLRKRRILHVRKRIPRKLIGFYGRTFLQQSLRISDRFLAARLSSKIIAELDREWLENLWELLGQQSVFEYLTKKQKSCPNSVKR